MNVCAYVGVSVCINVDECGYIGGYIGGYLLVWM